MHKSIRHFIALTALALVIALQPFAARAADLEHIMEGMGKAMKVVTSALIKHQPVAAADLNTAASKLVTLATSAADVPPKQLVDANGQPLPGMEPAIAQYKDLIGQLVVALTEMQAALAAGDQVAATQVLTGKVIPLQKQGHGLFKED